MGFDLLSWLKQMVGALNTAPVQKKIQDWIDQNDYPDLQVRAQALADYITTVIQEAQPNLDPATLKSTVEGIAKDILRNAAGVDPDAGQGMV